MSAEYDFFRRGSKALMANLENERLIRLHEVRLQTGLSRTVLYDLMRQGRFPRQVSIGPKAVAWVQSEVTAWIDERIALRAQ